MAYPSTAWWRLRRAPVVNNVLVVDDWRITAIERGAALRFTLTAGERYPIRLEFYENGAMHRSACCGLARASRSR